MLLKTLPLGINGASESLYGVSRIRLHYYNESLSVSTGNLEKLQFFEVPYI